MRCATCMSAKHGMVARWSGDNARMSVVALDLQGILKHGAQLQSAGQQLGPLVDTLHSDLKQSTHDLGALSRVHSSCRDVVKLGAQARHWRMHCLPPDNAISHFACLQASKCAERRRADAAEPSHQTWCQCCEARPLLLL